MSSAVLDASAVMAFLNGEPGADLVAEVLAESIISTVNLAEVVGNLAKQGMDPAPIRQNLDDLQLDSIALDRAVAERAGLMLVETRKAGLSLADRICLALAESERVPAYTADRAWAGLDIGVEIRVIR